MKNNRSKKLDLKAVNKWMAEREKVYKI